ncbi:MAG: TetR/AcrR family transcriptional regulator [Erysipelotrichaceae bacterium]|nr:TetR/AcrR family transcriptional regulator [Erysipelotrichaceae bacterium]
MANGDYEATHARILDCGKKIFKEEGFEKANLRAICNAAKVTTGAFYGHFVDKEALFVELVNPLVKEIKYYYSLYEKDSFEFYKKEESITSDTIQNILDKKLKGSIEMVKYFFKNKDIFEMLVFGSYGTKYNNFMDSIIDLEDINHIKILNMIYGEDEYDKVITKEGIHLINHAYYYALSKVAVHSRNINEAEKNALLISQFFNEGWKKMRGL